ncbi:hypothetical protein FNF28_02156 [Cafeteria roenbergensis]|uniref:DNA polymerase alpha subunit B n=1 Tax=Cafeteria roenbergensis TaxID=33653 RepID=A0A5A8DV68_CAFRO|nr:hypothetical protein FNF28_02156 [Cafeteria roenbergensis]
MPLTASSIASALAERGLDAKPDVLERCVLLASELRVDAEGLADQAEASAMAQKADSVTLKLLDSMRAAASRRARPSQKPQRVVRADVRSAVAVDSSFEAMYGMSAAAALPSSPAYASRTTSGQTTVTYAGAAAPAADVGGRFVALDDAEARGTAADAVPAGDPSAGCWAAGADGEGGSLVPRLVGQDEALFGAGSATSSRKAFFTTIEDVAASLDQRCDVLGRAAAGSAASALFPVKEPSQDEVTVAGRIVCDVEGEGRLNPASVLLEGSRRTSGGDRVQLDLMDCKAFALFPGQVVAARGMNATGSRMVVQSVAHGARLPLPRSPVAYLEAEAARCAANGSAPMRVWAAAGPYSLASDLEYQPLDDLLIEATQSEPPPDVLVLSGPFVDADHPHVRAGRIRVRNSEGQFVALAAQDLFMYKVLQLMSSALCTIPATTTDRFLVKPHPDRLPRLAQHLLEQRSYYPLFPPSKSTPLDARAYEHVEMPVTPDVLLLQSKLAAFVADIDGCLVVSGGTLSKSNAAGTFARIEISPMTTAMIKPEPAEDAAAGAAAAASAGVALHRVPERARVSVVRL